MTSTNGHSASTTRRLLRLLAVVAIAGAAFGGALVAQSKSAGEWRTQALTSVVKAAPALPPTSTYPVQLVLDDDGAETAFGATSGQFAKQFLWLNAFTTGSVFELHQIWVLFPAGQGVAPGDAIDLVVYTDTDTDPSNGATLERTISTTVQVADGNTFSVYTLATPLWLPAGNVLIGVIDRYVGATTPPTQPASLDTTTPQGRSWVVEWTGNPPNPAVLPGDLLNARIDDLTQTGGNWMIRGFGVPIVPVPTLDPRALTVLVLLLLGLGFWFARR